MNDHKKRAERRRAYYESRVKKKMLNYIPNIKPKLIDYCIVGRSSAIDSRYWCFIKDIPRRRTVLLSRESR
jgi:hypothetical protein